MATLIGIDIGQKRDYTAICVAEVSGRKVGKRTENHYTIHHHERLPLGTPYPEVAHRVCDIVEGARERTGDSPRVYVDATGVGQPIVDLIRPDVRWVWAVYFTHGDRKTRNADGSIVLGKAHLVSRLQALFQAGRLHLPQTEEAPVLVEELLNYEIRVDEKANDRYGAFKVGTHDDLVTALGLAVLQEVRTGGFLF